VQDLTGDYLAAVANLQQARRLSRALGDRLGEANALTCLRTVQRTTDQYAAAPKVAAIVTVTSYRLGDSVLSGTISPVSDILAVLN
jgi:hypothetical protein